MLPTMICWMVRLASVSCSRSSAGLRVGGAVFAAVSREADGRAGGATNVLRTWCGVVEMNGEDGWLTDWTGQGWTGLGGGQTQTVSVRSLQQALRNLKRRQGSGHADWFGPFGFQLRRAPSDVVNKSRVRGSVELTTVKVSFARRSLLLDFSRARGRCVRRVRRGLVVLHPSGHLLSRLALTFAALTSISRYDYIRSVMPRSRRCVRAANTVPHCSRAGLAETHKISNAPSKAARVWNETFL